MYAGDRGSGESSCALFLADSSLLVLRRPRVSYPASRPSYGSCDRLGAIVAELNCRVAAANSEDCHASCCCFNMDFRFFKESIADLEVLRD